MRLPSSLSLRLPRRLRLGLRYKLILALVGATAAVFALNAWQTLGSFDAAITDAVRQASIDDSNEIRAVLEEQMQSEDRRALLRLVDVVGHGPNVSWVGVIDVHGTAKVSSRPERLLTRLGEDTVERRQLEAWRASDRAGTVALVEPGDVLRTLSPLPNAAACQRCHSPSARVIGMLVIDRSLAPQRELAAGSRRRFVVVGGVLLVLLLGIIGLAVERTVLLRVQRLRAATRSLGSGDLAARARDGSPDELGDLARDFDEMARRLEAAMHALAAQRSQLEELVNGVADGVLLLDAAGRVLTVNRAFAARTAGAGPEPGAAYRDWVRAAGVDEAGQGPMPAERALLSGALEKEVVRAGRGERTEELYAQPLRRPDGAVVAVIEVWRDITDRRVLEEGLAQSERLASLGVLASSVAHEVGNPLAAIITAVDGLLGRLADGSAAPAGELREYLEIVRKQVFRCHTVTERLLGFARVPSDGAAAVDVGSAAREVMALVRQEARAQGVELEVRAAGPVLAAAPAMLLEQVFLNLVLNALKAMPGGGRLVVEAGEGAAGVVAAFTDTGPGMPAEVMRHLFEPFRRGRQERGGTGLGLFISQALLARAGGAIEVESAPGRGTTFRVRLRRAAAPAGARADGLAGGLA